MEKSQISIGSFGLFFHHHHAMASFFGGGSVPEREKYGKKKKLFQVSSCGFNRYTHLCRYLTFCEGVFRACFVALLPKPCKPCKPQRGVKNVPLFRERIYRKPTRICNERTSLERSCIWMRLLTVVFEFHFNSHGPFIHVTYMEDSAVTKYALYINI